jgi:superfamily II DNA or RNA helicase
MGSSKDSEPTFIGKRGYTISKTRLSHEEQQKIRDELTVSPYVPGAPVQAEGFPVYRESPKRFFLPRHYGISNYGNPTEMRVASGDDIDVPFAGDLRDYQNRITDKFISHATSGGSFGGGGLLDIYTGAGKTVMALNILSRLKKKTLIIVHKGFLVQQWEERIRQYLPTARIGRIQAQVVDVDDKDIVIGMLQSLSMKEYHEDQFASFGLTIVDEVHHISSEVFSRSLAKIVTLYTLGLSATMQRKDGLTKVFKMFLGDIVHKEKRDKEHQVLVKGISYSVDDDEFNEVEYDYRGTPKFSTMISKLCSYNHRSEFILDVIKRELERDRAQQIIVLAHNKSLLKYLHDAIEHRNIATVGYYVGGMKEADLKRSELRKVIIATYAMAAEALDIKSLTTLLLATPKTDVVQAVGRILRQKGHQPVVLDIIDAHEPFRNQWRKRQAFYRKEEYEIHTTDSSRYVKGEWDKQVAVRQRKANKSGLGQSTLTVDTSQDEQPKRKCLIKLRPTNISNRHLE